MYNHLEPGRSPLPRQPTSTLRHLRSSNPSSVRHNSNQLRMPLPGQTLSFLVPSTLDPHIPPRPPASHTHRRVHVRHPPPPSSSRLANSVTRSIPSVYLDVCPRCVVLFSHPTLKSRLLFLLSPSSALAIVRPLGLCLDLVVISL